MTIARRRTRRDQRTDNGFVPIALLGSMVLMPRHRSHEPNAGDARVRFTSGRIT